MYACTHSVVEAAASVLEAFPHAKLKFGQLPGSSFSKRRERELETLPKRESLKMILLARVCIIGGGRGTTEAANGPGILTKGKATLYVQQQP